MSEPYGQAPSGYGQQYGSAPPDYGQAPQGGGALPGAPPGPAPAAAGGYTNGHGAGAPSQSAGYDQPGPGAEPGYGPGPADPYAGQKRGREEEYGANKRPVNDGPRPGEQETVYRFLCDAKKLGALMGPQGARIEQIKQNTGARIYCIVDAPPGCDEKVIVISGSVVPAPGSQFNTAQMAIFEIFDTVLDMDRDMPTMGGPFLRMLMCSTQAGSLIGKAGVIIKEIKDKSGCANIKVLQPEDLPPCAIASDKLLHITGSPDSLRTALRLATERLRDSPPKEMPSHEPCQNAFLAASRAGPGGGGMGGGGMGGPPGGPGGPMPYRGGPPGGPGGPGGGPPMPYRGGPPMGGPPPGRAY